MSIFEEMIEAIEDWNGDVLIELINDFVGTDKAATLQRALAAAIETYYPEAVRILLDAGTRMSIGDAFQLMLDEDEESLASPEATEIIQILLDRGEIATECDFVRAMNENAIGIMDAMVGAGLSLERWDHSIEYYGASIETYEYALKLGLPKIKLVAGHESHLSSEGLLNSYMALGNPELLDYLLPEDITHHQLYGLATEQVYKEFPHGVSVFEILIEHGLVPNETFLEYVREYNCRVACYLEGMLTQTV